MYVRLTWLRLRLRKGQIRNCNFSTALPSEWAHTKTGYVNKFSLIQCNLFAFDSICIPICPSVVLWVLAVYVSCGKNLLYFSIFSCIDLCSIFFSECNVENPPKQSVSKVLWLFRLVLLILCAQFTKFGFVGARNERKFKLRLCGKEKEDDGEKKNTLEPWLSEWLV